MSQPYFEKGENTGHLLATLAKSQNPLAHITELSGVCNIWCLPPLRFQVLGIFT